MANENYSTDLTTSFYVDRIIFESLYFLREFYYSLILTGNPPLAKVSFFENYLPDSVPMPL